MHYWFSRTPSHHKPRFISQSQHCWMNSHSLRCPDIKIKLMCSYNRSGHYKMLIWHGPYLKVPIYILIWQFIINNKLQIVYSDVIQDVKDDGKATPGIYMLYLSLIYLLKTNPILPWHSGCTCITDSGTHWTALTLPTYPSSHQQRQCGRCPFAEINFQGSRIENITKLQGNESFIAKMGNSTF